MSKKALKSRVYVEGVARYKELLRWFKGKLYLATMVNGGSGMTKNYE
jgi:hypothetical protein